MSAVPSQAPPSSAPPAPDHTDQPPTASPTQPLPPVVEPPTPTSQPPPPPPPPSSQPPAPPTPTTHAVPEPSPSPPIPTATETATPIQDSPSIPSPPPNTSQLPSSIRPTRVPPRPTQTATAFPASSKPPTTDPSPLSAVAIVGIIFAVVAGVALLVCLFTRRAKRIKQFSTPASSPPRAPMTFKREPSPLLSPSYPHSQTSVSSNSTSPFRPPHKQHHPPPYLPNYGLSLRPQLIPPSNPSSQFPTTALSPNHLHPTQYVPTTSRNSFCTPSNGSSTAVWYGDPSHGMTLPPNSPYEDYLRLYNGDGSLADAAYYSDYSAAQAAASENLPPKPRLGETLFYETGEFRNQQETDPRYVSSRPVQGYEKPPNDVPPPTGKLSITNGYSSDVNSEDSDSFTGRYTRLASSGHAVGEAATRSSLRNSFSEPLGPVAGSKDGELSAGRLTPSGHAASYSSVRNCSSSEQVGPARRSEDGDSSTGNHRFTYAAGDTTTRSSARNFSAVRSEDGNSSTGRLSTSGRAVGNTETRLSSSEPIGRSENADSSTGRLTSTTGHHTTARSILGKSPLTSPNRVGLSENAEAFVPTDTQKIDVPPKRESLGKNHTDESDAGMISNRSSSFFSRLPSSSKPEPKVDSNGEISDGSAFDSSEDEGRKGYYSGDFRNI